MEVQSLQARRPDNAHALKEVGLDFVDEAYPWRFPLVRNLPWASGLMRMQEKWNIILPLDLQEASLSLLRGFREASSTNDTFRGIMYNQNTLTPNQKSADPLPALLFASKLLDVAVVVTHAENMTGNMQKQGSVSVPPLVVPRTMLDDQTGKLRGVRTLSDRRGWTRVIRNLQHELNSYKPVKETTLHPSELQTRPNCRLIHTALRLLGALSRKDMNSLVLKVLTNLESTAFFINFLLQGRYDFPSTSSALASVLQQSAEEEGINCEAFRNLPQITRLRQGLYLALSVSPLVLVCDVSPMSSNLSRVDMLRAWYHYGTHRPPVLKSVEMKLWSYLFAIARGSITAIDALQLFVKDAIQKVSLAGKEESFFNADVQSKAVMPTGIAYSATRLSRQFVALTVANTLNDPTGAQAKFGSSQNDSLSSSVDSRGLYESLDVSDILAPELWINGDVDYSSNESLGFDSANTPPASDSTSGDSSSSAQRAADMSNPGRSRTPASDDSLPPSKRRRISAKSRDGPRSPFIHRYAASNEICIEKPLSSGSYFDTGMRNSVRRLSPIRCSKFCSSQSPTLSAQSTKTRIRGIAYFLVSPDGWPSTYWPSFYQTSELDMLHRFVIRSNKYQRNNGNSIQFTPLTKQTDDGEVVDRLLAALSGSPVLHVHCCTEQEYLRLVDTAKLTTILAQDFIVIRSRLQYRGGMAGCEAVLAKIGTGWQSWTAVDESLAVGSQGTDSMVVAATFDEFLRHAQDGHYGKILCFPYIEDNTGSHRTASLSSDLYSMQQVSASIGGSSDRISEAESSSWHFVATANVYRYHHASPDGFNLEFHVEYGALMVFIGIDADNLSSAAVCTTFRADGHATLDATPDVVGLLLHAGDRIVLRGDVPYCTLTLEPTIAHGYHFYSVFTMENSYWALLRQYLRTSTHDLPGRCGRNVIPHIVRYLHDCITNHTTDFLANCSAITGRHRHLPDVRKVDGILQLFALLAIVELDEIIGNRCPVHRRNERQNPGPFHDLLPLVEGIVDVLDSALYVSEKTRPVSIAFNDMWTSFLVQQSVALIVASRSAANPVETPPTVAARILETMGRRSNRIKCGIERLLAGRPCYFGASDMLSLTYDQCVSFKWAFAEQVSRFQLRFEPGGNG